MVVYYGKTKDGFWKASPNPQILNGVVTELHQTNLTTVNNNKVYVIVTYHGYDCDYYTGVNTPIISCSKLFHSVQSAQNSDKWKDYKSIKDIVEISPVELASNDNAHPFTQGSLLDGKFHARILGLKLI